MSKKTDHTFVVLAHKESPYIEECLQSLENQTTRSRILVSTSTPSEFLNEAAVKHGTEIVHNTSGGCIATDWTFAYERAETQFVTLAHQDDIYHRDYVKRCLSAALTTPQSLITFTDYDELHGKSIRPLTLNMAIKRVALSSFFPFGRSLYSRTLKVMMLSLGSPISCPSVMFNKKAIGDFAFASDFVVSLDWEAWLRLARRNGAFVYVKKRLMAHRIHAESQTTACIRSDRRRNEDRAIFEQLWPAPIAHALAGLYSWSYRS
jgi:cellulose synthase/poly-beta-1,6-N-acetylglucosamine synthase-like glycosyltransferase